MHQARNRAAELSQDFETFASELSTSMRGNMTCNIWHNNVSLNEWQI